MLKEAFGCSLNSLYELQLVLIDFIVKYETEKCTSHLKSVSDIPRLYRRTNREAPKTPSMYVGLAVEVISEFRHAYANKARPVRQRELIGRCMQSIVDSLCIKYQAIANDLLESVRMMEDSLKRLQQFKRQSNRSLANMTASGSMSDDDKIRLQLYLDIVEFGRLLESKFDGYRGEANYDALYKLVEDINSNGSAAATSNANGLKETNGTTTNDDELKFSVVEENQTDVI